MAGAYATKTAARNKQAMSSLLVRLQHTGADWSGQVRARLSVWRGEERDARARALPSRVGVRVLLWSSRDHASKTLHPKPERRDGASSAPPVPLGHSVVTLPPVPLGHSVVTLQTKLF